jgi:hypothetical protein
MADFVSSIPVVITASLRLAGKTIDKGTTIRPDPASAAAVVASGRGRLERPEDRAAIDAYWKQETDRTLALCGRVPNQLRFGR